MRSGLFIFLSLITSLAGAADNKAVSFYRSQQSLFPSGQARRENLEAKILRRDTEPWFRIQWNKKNFEVPGETLIRDLHVTQNLITKEALELRQEPREDAKKITRLQAQRSLKVLRTNTSWALLQDPQGKLQGWAPLYKLSAPVEDSGVFLTLVDSFLKKAPNSSAPIITTIPRLQRLLPLGIENNYLRISYQGHVGYLDLANLAGRGDFAMWAYHQNQGWLGISHRENGFLFTVNKQKIPLTNFIAFNPYLNRGISCQKLSDEAPSIRSRVEIVDNRAHLWALSFLEGHGEVWWRTSELEQQPAPPPSGSHALSLTTEKLIQRELNAVAFAKNSMKGLASAKGIFRTEDGKTWTELPFFEGKNYPLAIHPDGIWYVGNFRSYDEGKSFEPYIKWDLLAAQIQIGTHRPPRHLRITSIEPLSHSRIRLHVDTGSQKVKMQAHVLSQEWKLVK